MKNLLEKLLIKCLGREDYETIFWKDERTGREYAEDLWRENERLMSLGSKDYVVKPVPKN